jgi:hypothetical protein
MANVARGNPARWWIGRSCGGASRAPRALLVGRLRRVMSVAALAFLLLLLGGMWLVTNPQRLSRLSEVLLSRVLGGNVRVRTARLSLSGTLIFSGVEVRPADSEPTATSDIPIFAAEQIEARFDWFSLLTGQLSATQLVATTPVFRAIEEQDAGHWNYERLRPEGMGGNKPRSGGKPGLSLPVVILRDAHVKWGEARQGRVEQTAETIINGEMTPDPVMTSTYHFQFSQLAPGKDLQTPLAVGATLHGTWDSAANVFSMTTENVVMSDALRNGLPRPAREWCDEHHLAGRLSQLSMTFNPRDGLVLAVAFEKVSMMWMVAPQPGIAVGEERPAYPLDVSNVRGRVVFTLKQPAMQIIDLTGDVLGYHFVADCDVQGTSLDAPFSLRLRFPQANLGDRYPPLFLAAITSQDLLQRIAPHGRMDIAVEIRREAARDPLTFNGTIDCHDSRMRFAHFPFPLDHVQGRITFDQQRVTFRDVEARADLNTVTIAGSCGTVKTNKFVDLIITSRNTYFDDRLAACLPQQYQDIWNSFAVRGHGGFVCRVTRGGAPTDPQKIVVDVDLDDGEGYVKAVPYYFSQAQGHLHFEADQTRVEHLTARTGGDGSGTITLDGVVRHKGGDVTHLLPELNIRGDVPLDAQLLHALPEELTARLGDTALGGRLEFDGVAQRKAGPDAAPSLQLAGTLDWKQGTLKTQVGGQAVALANIAAQTVLSPDAVDVKSFAGDLDLGADMGRALGFGLSGKLALPQISGEMQVELRGQSVTLPAAAPAAFPGSLRELWHDNAPTGRVDLDASAKVRVNMPADGTAVPAPLWVSEAVSVSTYRAGVALHDVALRQAGWPSALDKLNGTVEVVPGRVSMTDMAGVMGNVKMAWQGQVIPETGHVALSGTAESKGWPEHWMQYVPEGIVKRLDMKREGTTLALRLDSLSRDATGEPWSYAGKLEAANIATTGWLRTETQKVELEGKGAYGLPALAATNPAAGREPVFDFTGKLTAAKMKVSDQTVETLKAKIEAAGTRHTITVSDIDGQVAGGTLQGKILIRTIGEADATQPAATTAAGVDGSYQADLVLHDAELSRLLVPGIVSEEERKKVSSGRVTASLSLQETFGVQADRTGRGELTVQDGNMYKVPLSMGLMQMVTLRLPVARSFQQANMSYYLRNDEVTFDKILLQSDGINLAGLGTVSLADHAMDMSFVTESPHEVFIPIISDILRETRNELLQLAVTGTVENPKITPVPLSAISNVLRLLLPRQKADARH